MVRRIFEVGDLAAAAAALAFAGNAFAAYFQLFQAQQKVLWVGAKIQMKRAGQRHQADALILPSRGHM
jgi:hypothetical protein